VQQAGDFLTLLRESGIEPSWKVRYAKIVEEARGLAQKHGADSDLDEGLLSKCTGISESHYVFEGTIDAE
jgi:glycyl-tRNA synthetase beta subunit